MESEWKAVALDIVPYKDTGTFIMKVSEDCSQLLDDHIVMTQSMSFSPFKKPFEDRITTWEGKLVMTQVLLYSVFDSRTRRSIMILSFLYLGRDGRMAPMST